MFCINDCDRQFMRRLHILLKLLLDATCKNLLTSAAIMADIEEALKLWLRGADDRNGGRNERA